MSDRPRDPLDGAPAPVRVAVALVQMEEEELEIKIDARRVTWWIDLRSADDLRVSMVWSAARRAFGVYAHAEGFGEGPDHVTPSPVDAVRLAVDGIAELRRAKGQP